MVVARSHLTIASKLRLESAGSKCEKSSKANDQVTVYAKWLCGSQMSDNNGRKAVTSE